MKLLFCWFSAKIKNSPFWHFGNLNKIDRRTPMIHSYPRIQRTFLEKKHLRFQQQNCSHSTHEIYRHTAFYFYYHNFISLVRKLLSIGKRLLSKVVLLFALEHMCESSQIFYLEFSNISTQSLESGWELEYEYLECAPGLRHFKMLSTCPF